MLAVILSSEGRRDTRCSETALSILKAGLKAPSLSVFGRAMINSSPPHLAIMSISLRLAVIVLDISLSTTSPALCPNVSLTLLKWSISSKKQVRGSLYLAARKYSFLKEFQIVSCCKARLNSLC